jgi:hypothetical protein
MNMLGIDGRAREFEGDATHLTTETGLLSVVTTLTLSEEGSLASL